MIESFLIANRSQILPGTGRGTMRSMVEGYGSNRVSLLGRDVLGVPLHHLRLFPSPGRSGT
jgi:hypothetical protein